MAARAFLRRVAIRNYKSIRHADVTLGPLTVLVGRNGSGKSNFLDVLDFVATGLQGHLSNAVKWRGGIEALLHRRGSGRAPAFTIELDMVFGETETATFELELAAREQGGFFLQRESLTVQSVGEPDAYYTVKAVRGGPISLSSSIENMPPASPDRLYLVSAAGFLSFSAVFDFLGSMGSYNLNPGAMRDLHPPEPADRLRLDGSNAASVIAWLKAKQPQILDRINSYLTAIVPEFQQVERIALGSRETLQFKLGTETPISFLAESMSDGTLRALGALLAAFQGTGKPSVVGIEEPENSLHPAAAGALMDAFREASSKTQILLTSHSPDLLDQVDLESDRLLAVISEGVETRIALIDEASREAIRRNLYSPGELLRQDQLEPDRNDLARQDET